MPVPVVVRPVIEVVAFPPMANDGAMDVVGEGPRLLKLVPLMAVPPRLPLEPEPPPGAPPPPPPPPIVVVVEVVPPGVTLVLGACANTARGANNKIIPASENIQDLLLCGMMSPHLFQFYTFDVGLARQERLRLSAFLRSLPLPARQASAFPGH